MRIILELDFMIASHRLCRRLGKLIEIQNTLPIELFDYQIAYLFVAHGITGWKDLAEENDLPFLGKKFGLKPVIVHQALRSIFQPVIAPLPKILPGQFLKDEAA